MARVYVHDAVELSTRYVRWTVGYTKQPAGLFGIDAHNGMGTGFFRGLDMSKWQVGKWVNLPDRYWDAEPGVPEWLISVGEC